MKVDVVFVCQQGELEVMASLLATSLRKFCDHQVYLHIIEPIPNEEYGVISPTIREFLDGLDVKWYQFRNPISDQYKIFNKLNAFNIQPQGERILFLDSDVVIRRPFLQALESYWVRPFAARCADKQRFSATAEGWEPVYRLFDLPVPSIRWPAAYSRQWGPPYFNAGVILVDPALDFSRHWIDTCLRIHQEESIKIENRGTVQIGLPIVLYRRHIPYALLDRRFNFSLNQTWLKMRRSWINEEAYIVHYYNPKNILNDSAIQHEVSELVKDFKLEDIFAMSRRWQKLLKTFRKSNTNAVFFDMPPNPSLFTLRAVQEKSLASSKQATVKPAAPSSDFSLESRMVFITGIPRSGASLFSSLLAELSNVTVLNEPDVMADFNKAENLEAFGLTWKNWRDDIARSRTPLMNTNGGQAAGTTFQENVQYSLTRIRDSNFVLAVKNTLGNLSHLQRIINAFPRATIFIAVRNPFDTIATWLKLPYLGDGKVIDQDKLAGIDAPFLAKEQRESLYALRDLNDLAMKRAGLWDYFAGLVKTCAGQVHIFRYEDMIENPEAVLRYAYEKLFPGLQFELPDINLRNREQQSQGMLTEWDKECIRAICSYNAGVFDYNLYEF